MKKIILALFCLQASLLFADMSFDSIYRDYKFSQSLIDEDQEITSLNYHTYSIDSALNELDWFDREFNYMLFDAGKWGTIKYSPLETFTSYNSKKPYGGNDGALWQGKGFNNITRIGIQWNTPFLLVRFNPEFWVAQNQDFNTLPSSVDQGYGDYWTSTDNLQRYGDDSYHQFDWGNTTIRANYKEYLTVGFSFENIVLGPGRQNNILLSDNAQGFPHIDMGTFHPIKIPYIGLFEGKLIWGSAEESAFYDGDSPDSRSWLNAISLSLAPTVLPGLTLGVNNLYYIPLNEWSPYHLVASFIPRTSNNTAQSYDEDRMISLTFDWKFPKVGFTTYGEWAKNDGADFLYQPEHCSAFVLGAAQQVSIKSIPGYFLLSTEFANLGQTRTGLTGRAAGPWYRHSWGGFEQGYTNNGQWIGAEIGPGSNSQWIDLSYFLNKGKFSFSYTRVCYDNDYWYNNVVDSDNPTSENINGSYIDRIFSLEALYFIEAINLFSRLDLIDTKNFNWQPSEDFFNIHVEIGLAYQY